MWLVLEQTPKIELLEGNTIISFLQKLPSSSQNSDASSRSSISISGFRAGRVEPGPCLAIISSRARRVESRLDPSLSSMYFYKPNSKMASKINLGHSLMTEMPRHNYILFIKSDKSQKWSAQNKAIFELLGLDFQKIFSKFFFHPNQFPRWFWSFLYL